MIPPALSAVPSPTDGLDALRAAGRGARVAAAALRWAAACAVAFAALLALSVALATGDRSGAPDPAQPSASAYLDFDLGVLQALAQRTLAGAEGSDALAGAEGSDALRTVWGRRPAWTLRAHGADRSQLVSLRDAWAASTAGKSRFRAAARGAWDALGILLAGLSLALLAAGAGGAFAERVRSAPPSPRSLSLGAATVVLVALPLSPLLDAALLYDRTRSVGAGLPAALFVAAFAGASSGAAARALFAPPPQAAFLSALRGRPALLSAARLSVLEATRWLVPLVPALAAAAVFVCAKADQDPARTGDASGLGGLIRATMQEVSAGERIASAALVGGALVVLWYLGHRFVAEARSSLRAAGSAE